MNRNADIVIAGKRYPMRCSIGATIAISERYGSIKEMADKVSSGAEHEMLHEITWIAELLIRQGCEYKNVFEPNCPVADDAPVQDGKYVPVTAGEIALAMTMADMENLKEAVLWAVVGGRRQNVQTEKDADPKNAETT